MWRILLVIAVLAALLIAAFAAEKPQPRADLVIINRGDVNTLDVQRMSWLQDLRIAAVVYERLVEHDIFSPDFRVRPAGAESWDISPDGLTYTFHLRASARWSNGQPVIASDFIRTFRRALMPDTAGDYVDVFRMIEGASEFYEWRQQALNAFAAATVKTESAEDLYARTLKRFDELVALKAPDNHTLVIGLARRVPYFLDLCAFEGLSPFYMDEVERWQTLDPVTGRISMDLGWTKPGRFVCNGPFVVSQWRFKRDMRLERNPHYWNKAAINIDSISMPSINEANAVLLAFESGGIDWVSDVVADYKRDMILAKQAFYQEHASEYEALKAQGLDPAAIDRRLPPDPRKNIHVFPAFGTYFFNFNCAPRLTDGRPNPFADARVRRAFALAVDKARVADIRGIGESIADVLIPPGSLAGYTAPTGRGQDVEEARRLLAEAGYPEGKGFPTVEVLLSKDGGHELVTQSMASDWRAALGIETMLLVKEVKVFSEEVKQHRFMLSRAGWFGDYGDPTTFLDINRTGNGNNDRQFSSPAFDALLAKAEAQPDAAARLAVLKEAERLLVEDEFPFLPLVHYAQVYMFDASRLSGISPHPRQKQLLYLCDVMGDGKGTDTVLEMPTAIKTSPPAKQR